MDVSRQLIDQEDGPSTLARDGVLDGPVTLVRVRVDLGRQGGGSVGLGRGQGVCISSFLRAVSDPTLSYGSNPTPQTLSLVGGGDRGEGRGEEREGTLKEHLLYPRHCAKQFTYLSIQSSYKKKV